MVPKQMKELLLQSLEHERGGVLIYQTALECAQHPDLKKEWQKYLAQTRQHVESLAGACVELGIDPGEISPGRRIVHHNGKALVVAMKMALAENNAMAAQLVACECVVLAETKDHFNWQLIGHCAAALGAEGAPLKKVYDNIEDEEDEHLYHTKGWCRELWLGSLGLESSLPPPEETAGVHDAVSAAEVAAASTLSISRAVRTPGRRRMGGGGRQP